MPSDQTRESRELANAIRVIENTAGFEDPTTAVGWAWERVLRELRQHKAQSGFGKTACAEDRIGHNHEELL